MGGAPCKSAKEGGGCSFKCFTFNHESVPMLSPDGTQHSEWHCVTVSMVQVTVHTALAMSEYVRLHKVLCDVHNAWLCTSQTPCKAHSRSQL